MRYENEHGWGSGHRVGGGCITLTTEERAKWDARVAQDERQRAVDDERRRRVGLVGPHGDTVTCGACGGTCKRIGGGDCGTCGGRGVTDRKGRMI